MLINGRFGEAFSASSKMVKSSNICLFTRAAQTQLNIYILGSYQYTCLLLHK